MKNTFLVPNPFIATHRKTLLSLLKAYAYKEGYFILSSGAHSTFMVDCKNILLTSTGHKLVGHLIIDAILSLQTPIHGVAGVALGGCSLASAASTLSSQWSGRQPFDALYIRKETKDHGTQKLIEGQLLHGKSVVLLEDVLTTGKSSMAAIDILVKGGYEVKAVICVVDRLEGGKDAIMNKYGIPVVSLFTIDDVRNA